MTTELATKLRAVFDQIDWSKTEDESTKAKCWWDEKTQTIHADIPMTPDAYRRLVKSYTDQGYVYTSVTLVEPKDDGAK